MISKYELLFALGLEPEEAINYFRRKGYAISFDWRDVWQEAHRHSFTVAKVMKEDLLKVIREEVDKYISQGLTPEQSIRFLQPKLISAGWWGKVKAKDVPGVDASTLEDPEKEVQLGSHSRIKKILRINETVAHSAGRYKQMAANASFRPYWMYNQLDRPTKRLTHAKLAGKIFMYDDPIWDVIFPPNGWFCQCWIKALTEKEFKATGKRLSKGSEIKLESVGIEEGWKYNPGLNPEGQLTMDNGQ